MTSSLTLNNSYAYDFVITFTFKSLLICFGFFCIHYSADAQGKKEIEISGFTVEINNEKIDYDLTIQEEIVDLEPKDIVVFQNYDFTYVVEFRFKRSGNRIKVRRISEVRLKDGTRIRGNRKKEVQFMSASAPGLFEFPVAENIVLNKGMYSTFFVSYRVNVKYV